MDVKRIGDGCLPVLRLVANKKTMRLWRDGGAHGVVKTLPLDNERLAPQRIITAHAAVLARVET